MLISYDIITQQLRLHFNMKEPNRIGAAFYAESDLQWNTYLDLADPT